MPSYEYRCLECRKRVSLYQKYEEYGNVSVQCPPCDRPDLKRIIVRVRFARSEESRLESLADPSSWADFDEQDPRSMARMLRKMGQEMGEEMPTEFDEVIGRLDAGESPEDIEKSMPELGGVSDNFDIED